MSDAVNKNCVMRIREYIHTKCKERVGVFTPERFIVYISFRMLSKRGASIYVYAY